MNPTPETAYVRRVLFALEVLDGVSLARVRDARLRVKALGLRGKPIVNHGGLLVWLEEGNRAPQGLEIDPGGLPYLESSLPANALAVPAPPPPNARPPLISIQLAPRPNYPFAAGVTAIRGRLVRQRNQSPPAPIAGASVWLRWIDDNAAGTTWMDAPVRSTTDANGDFAAALRLSPAQVARLDANGHVRLRLCAERPQVGLLASPEFQHSPGRVADARQTFAWDEFTQP